MWLYLPSASAPGSECSTTELTSPSAERCALSCSWRGKPSVSRIWQRRWNKVVWLRRLSGLTCEPSAAQSAALSWAARLADEGSACSSAESHASHTACPGSAVGRAMNATWWPLSWTRLASTCPRSRLSRTSQASLPGMEEADSPGFAMDWAAWVTGLRQDYSARLRWAQATGDNGSSCSAWQTPDAGVMGTRRQGATLAERQTREPEALLRTQAATWPTPRGEERSQKNSADAGVSTSKAAETWPTPSATDDKGVGQPDGRRPVCDDDLPTGVERWPTPEANDSGANQRGPGLDSSRGADLKQGVENWPTPAAQNWRSGQASAETFEANPRPLQEWACRFPATPPDPPTSAHGRLLRLLDQISYPPAGQRRLNPAFAEWLMGWPPGWTDFEPLGTGLTPSWRPTLSALCGQLSRVTGTLIYDHHQPPRP